MGQIVYIGANYHYGGEQNIYPAYASRAAAFSDISQMLTAVNAMEEDLFFDSEGYVEFTVAAQIGQSVNYCCWAAGSEYKFAVVESVERTGVSSRKIRARRDFITEYLPSIVSGGYGYFERMHIRRDYDTFGNYTISEPSAIGQIKINEQGTIINSLESDGSTNLIPVVSLYGTPEPGWQGVSPIKPSLSSTYQKKPIATVIMVKEGFSISKSNIYDGFSYLFELIQQTQINISDIALSVSLVPYNLINYTSSGKMRIPSTNAGDLGIDCYILKENMITTFITAGVETGAYKKALYGNGSKVSLYSYGTEILSLSLCDCYTTVETVESTDLYKVYIYYSFIPSETPTLRVKIRRNGIPADNEFIDDKAGGVATVPFPTLSLVDDTFKVWWANNSYQRGANIVQSVLSLAAISAGLLLAPVTEGASIAVGAKVAAGLGAASVVSSAVNKEISFEKQKTSAQIDSVSISQSTNDIQFSKGGHILSAAVWALSPNDMSAANAFYNRYGYALNGRRRWYKPGTADDGWCYYKGRIEINSYGYWADGAKQAIETAFANGITLVSTDEMTSNLLVNFNNRNTY